VDGPCFMRILTISVSLRMPVLISNSIELSEPSQHAVFVNDVLYIFAANVDFPSQTVEAGYSPIEDVYTLDLSMTFWIYE